MARGSFTLLPAVSLLLCVAVAGLWVRSAWYEDWLLVRAGGWRLSAGSDAGSFGASLGRSELSERPLTYRGVRHPPRLHLLRFAADVSGRGVLLAVPHWLGVLLLLLPPAVTTLRARRRRRHAVGLCPSCGYDLRATPDRCPECGGKPPRP